MKPNQDTSLVAPVLKTTLDVVFSIERLAFKMAENPRNSSDNSAFKIAIINMSNRLIHDLMATLQSMNEKYELDRGDTQNTEVEFLLCESHGLANSVKTTVEKLLEDNGIDALNIIEELARGIGVRLNKVKDHYRAIGLFDDKEVTHATQEGTGNGPEYNKLQCIKVRAANALAVVSLIPKQEVETDSLAHLFLDIKENLESIQSLAGGEQS